MANRPAIAFTLAAAIAGAIAGCVERQVAPTPPPRQTPRPAPSPTPAPPPLPPADWRDAPITPGNWSYRAEPGGSAALFGSGTGDEPFALRCDRVRGLVTLARAGAAQGAVPLTVTTTSIVRAFSAAPQAGTSEAGTSQGGTSQAGTPPRLVVALTARDPLLDAMAFSRGRFMVETPGLPTLYLPAWPEVARLVEDCR